MPLTLGDTFFGVYIRVICLGLIEDRVFKTAVRCPSVKEGTLAEFRICKITVTADEIGEVTVFKECTFHVQLIDSDIRHLAVFEYRTGKIGEAQVCGIELTALKQRVLEDSTVELVSAEVHIPEPLAGKVCLFTAGDIVYPQNVLGCSHIDLVLIHFLVFILEHRNRRTEVKAVFDFNENYKKFISDCKTERECVSEAIALAKSKGYRDLNEVIQNHETLKAGDKVYAAHMKKTLALFHIGKEPLEKGLKILGAHIDSPRIDIKQNPLYEDNDLVLLDTHYYGGIKKYQWVTLPLALHGVVVKKDGSVINVVIGEDESDPVVGISDLLIHLAGDQMAKTASKVIEGEDLNVLVGSIPSKSAEKDKSKEAILTLLK